MKLKKLLAAVVAGVLALTMAPIAISAATWDTTTTYAGAQGGVALSLSVNGRTVSWNRTSVSANPDSPTAAFTGEVTIPYDVAQSNFSFGWTKQAGATVTHDVDLENGTDFVNFPVIASNSASGYFITFDTAMKVANASTTVTFTVINPDNPWVIRKNASIEGGDGNPVKLSEDVEIDTATYALTFVTDISAKSLLQMANQNDPCGTFEVTDSTGLGQDSGAGVKKFNANPGDTVVLTAPTALNGVNDNAPFDGFKFSKKVRISAATDMVTGPRGGDIEAGESHDIVYGKAEDTITFIMPAGGLTITAFDVDGFNYGTKSSTSSNNNNNNNTSDTTGRYRLSVSGSTYHNGSSNILPGTVVTLYPSTTQDFQYWTVTGLNGTYNTSVMNFSFTMPENTVTITANNYNESNITATTNGYGSASANKSRANQGEIVEFTASGSGTVAASGGMMANDPANWLGLGTSSYYYPTTYTYAFNGWSFNRTVSYVSGYSSTSNPTRVYMPSGNLTGTANFTPTASAYPYIPTTPSTPSSTTNSNSFSNNGATATINTSSGVITAGINTTGSVNSTATANALKSAVSRKLIDGTPTVVVPSTSTGISKSTMQKLITAAGNTSIRVQIQGTFGTILIPVSSARQINARVLTSSNALTNAKATFKKAFGNNDIVGIQTAQATTYGASAQYRISADAIGLNVDYGDTAYVALYNPTTKKYSAKTVMVNANGQIAFASSYSGIILFSAMPFSNK
ncbi:MAG: hypothetical protein LBM41_06025 [Ruminococcus sp.]|jgi:hypothetical protein|nr:hypothetical protein [Ruminococcus sp.]